MAKKQAWSTGWCFVLRITAATIHLYFHYLDVIMIPLSSFSTMGEEQMLNEAGDENSADLNLQLFFGGTWATWPGLITNADFKDWVIFVSGSFPLRD